nr:exodeoxyribonuclease VII small subunit [Alteromonas profundi]
MSALVTKKTDSSSFEETLSELDSIVTEMENGDLPLEVALEKFERGIALSRQGQKSLEQAEQKISILLNEQGENALRPFSDDEQP